MIRAYVVQVMDKAWLEVEQYRPVDRVGKWVSIGRLILGPIDGIGNMGEAVEVLLRGLEDLLELQEEDWYQLDAYRI